MYANAVPEKTPMPYVVYRKLSTEPLMTLSGYAGMTKSVFVFDSWGETYADAMSTADAVRTAIEAAAGITIKFREPGDPDDYEPAIDSFVEPSLYSFWHP